MNKQNNGGPAFPCDLTYTKEDGVTYRLASDGMSLRDYYAGHALGELLRSDVWVSSREVAQRSFEIADAMLEARGE